MIATISVDDKVIRTDLDRFFGINVSYIRDADSNRPNARPLAKALSEIGCRWIRYPGGAKSDNYRWALPPYEVANPQSIAGYEKYPGDRMDFDSYIRLCREVGAEPYVVLGYHNFAHSGLTRQEWIDSACAWVRYSNKTKNYGVRYWEIGNENWNTGKGPAEELADVVIDFVRALRPVDPTIRLGAGVHDENWNARFLPRAAPHLDFISYSHYSAYGFGGYDPYLRERPPNVVGALHGALDWIRRWAGDLPLIIAETNSTDYGPDPVWKHSNDMGHALVAFDTLGYAASEREVQAAMLWNTRWMQDDEDSQIYALGAMNEIHPSGRALQMWSAFAESDLVVAKSDSSMINAFAAKSADGARWTVWISNRGLSDLKAEIVVPRNARVKSIHRLVGASPTDIAPVFECASEFDGRIPALSISAIQFAW